MIRATSLSGVANHYVSISPGPNSSPALGRRTPSSASPRPRPRSTSTSSSTPSRPSVRKGLSNFIKGNAAIYAGQGKAGNEAFKYFGPALNRTDAFVKELNADQRLLERFIVGSSKTRDHRRLARRAALERDRQRQHGAFSAIATQNVALDSDPATAAAGDAPEPTRPSSTCAPPSTTSIRSSTRPSRRPRTWPPSSPNCARSSSKFDPLHAQPAADRGQARQGKRRRLNCWPLCRPCRKRAAKTFPHAEDAIADFQPNLNFARAYTPDIFNGLGKLGTGRRLLRRQRPLRRAPSVSAQNLFAYEGGTLNPITKSPAVRRLRRLGPRPPPLSRRGDAGRRPTAPTRSSTRPSAAAVSASECNPADAPPGP